MSDPSPDSPSAIDVIFNELPDSAPDDLVYRIARALDEAGYSITRSGEPTSRELVLRWALEGCVESMRRSGHDSHTASLRAAERLLEQS